MVSAASSETTTGKPLDGLSLGFLLEDGNEDGTGWSKICFLVLGVSSITNLCYLSMFSQQELHSCQSIDLQ